MLILYFCVASGWGITQPGHQLASIGFVVFTIGRLGLDA
jgi:hypothetical protein